MISGVLRNGNIIVLAQLDVVRDTMIDMDVRSHNVPVLAHLMHGDCEKRCSRDMDSKSYFCSGETRRFTIFKHHVEPHHYFST